VYRFGHYAKGDKRSKWIVVKEDEIREKIIDKANNFNCFVTVQSWQSQKDALNNNSSPHISPLYFDIDSEDLNESKESTIKILRYLIDYVGLEMGQVRVFFSGKKGFHIIVSPESIGISPSPVLTYMFKNIAIDLKHIAPSIDTSVYSRPRMLRIINSAHQSSRLFKVELTLQEIESFTVQQIEEMASSPRSSPYPSSSEFPINDTSIDWYREYELLYEDQQEVKQSSSVDIVKSDGYPVCVEHVMNKFFPRQGDRNRATLAMACFMKSSGKLKEEAGHILVEWAKTIPKELTTTTDEDVLKNNTLSVVKSVYSNDKYKFACPFMLGLSTQSKKIPCAAPNCEFIKGEEEPSTITKVHLSESSMAKYTGTYIETEVLMIGINETPYIVPITVRASCPLGRKNNPDTSCKVDFCPMHTVTQAGKSFSTKSIDLIEYLHGSDTGKENMLRKIFGIPPRKCPIGDVKKIVEVVKSTNIEECVVVPLANNEETKSKYVTRKCYVFNHGLSVNRHYVVRGVLHPEPKSDLAILVCDYCEPIEDDVSSFKVDESIIEHLKVFKPDVDNIDGVISKMNHILEVFESNVHLIFGRRHLGTALELAYHSVVSIKFQGINYPRGWVEVIVIGDTSTGKTSLVEKMMEYYGVGRIVSGENLKRTGLTYAMYQTSNNKWMIVWGEIPQADRKLLVIDEFNSTDPTLLADISRARSTGVLQVSGAARSEVNSRTRLFIMTNPRGNRRLDSFSFGIESILKLVPQLEDIRRFDLCIGCSSNDVGSSLLNRPSRDIHRVDNQYHPEICKELILFAWSRGYEDIIIDDVTEDAILSTSKKLSAKYHASIPLIEGADIRVKLARIATALAVRMFSVNDDCKVIVKPHHVEFVYRYLSSIYDNNNLDYRGFSEDKYKKSPTLDNEIVDEIDSAMSSFENTEEILIILRGMDSFTKTSVADQTGLSRDEANALIKRLSGLGLIYHIKNQFRKTPLFISYIRNKMSKEVVEGDMLFETSTPQQSLGISEDSQELREDEGDMPEF
jgi:hypothetical protein